MTSEPRAESDRRSRPGRISEEVDRWLEGPTEKTLGGLIDLFDQKSFAVLFVFLLALPALPLPTGGATHVLEVIAVLLALQLIAGRDAIGLPNRWLQLELGGTKQERLLATLLRMIRRLERIVFGALVIVGCTAAFVAPPFTGLDTLPALAVVLRLGEERGPDDAAEREQRADQQRHADCVARVRP